MTHVIAIDLGASSGRVMVGTFENNQITLEEHHRFLNQQHTVSEQSCWDLYTLLEEIDAGIVKVISKGINVSSLAIDTWGVDFVLLDEYGKHLGDFVSYRDDRTRGKLQQLLDDNHLTHRDIYAQTGIQFLSFNTLYQLKAITDQKPAWLDRVHSLLFIPDYLNYKLCGVMHCEYTNASTSQLLDCKSKQWATNLIEACGAQPHWFLEPKMPNQIIGEYNRAGIDIPVCSVASHDTASAIAAAPLDETSAYLSSGTWSLLGIESMTPYTSDLAFKYNITNEGGVDGRFRVLKNIMGLWLLQRLRAENPSLSFSDITLLAKNATPFQFIVDPNDETFLNPPSMTEAIKQWFTTRNKQAPTDFSEVVRCVYDSLALAYSCALEQLIEVSSRDIQNIRIVGGGAQDTLLNQLCADVCQMPVSIEPIEASALGNVANQLIAINEIQSLDEAREIISLSNPQVHYFPTTIHELAKIKASYKKLI